MMPANKPPNPGKTGAAFVRGASIGRYVVLSLVGRGGMGEVYAAYDPELDRKVAVKLLRAKPGNGVSLSEGRARILREAQAIAKLSHPNVVVVYDVGTFQDQVFIAMEFLEGHTLGYWLHERERTWKEVLRVFLAAGRGLLAAHEKDLVHRDFKPDNVMVDKDGQVRVMDFGLARQLPEKSGDTSKTLTPTKERTTTTTGPVKVEVLQDTMPVLPPDPEDLKSTNVLPPPGGVVVVEDGRPIDTMPHITSSAFEAQLTRTGSMMGTPAYMSPEQFLGTPTDSRTDQFSFCVALYEGLYGERPFAGNTLFGLTANVVQENVSPPPANTKVPAWVRKVLLRGLKADANHRYASMEELLAALERDPGVKRKKVGLLVAGLMLPILVGIAVRQSTTTQRPMCEGGIAKLAGIWELEDARRTETESKARVRNALLRTGKPYAESVYTNVHRALNAYVRDWADMYRHACEATHVRGEQSAEVLDLRMSCLNERLDSVKALTHVFSDATDEVVSKAVSAVHALPGLERCSDIPLLRAVVRPPDDPLIRARVENLRHRLVEAKALDDAGRWATAMEKGSTIEREVRTLDYKPLIAETLNLLGALQHKLGNPKEAERTYEQGYWAAEVSHHDEVRAEIAAGQVWVVGYLLARYEEGERWGRHAEAVLQRLGSQERLRSWVLNNLSGVYGLQGRPYDALKAQQQALSLKEKVLPPDHPDVALSLANTAVFLREADRNSEALEHIDRALMILEKGVGPHHPDFANQLSNRGDILRALGRSADARESFERALAIWDRELGKQHPLLGYALTGIGQTYLDARDAVHAIPPLERALTIRETTDGAPTLVAETAFALSRALWLSQRDPRRAQLFASRARAAFVKAGATTQLPEIDAWLSTISIDKK